jgi:hypothetical protein
MGRMGRGLGGLPEAKLDEAARKNITDIQDLKKHTNDDLLDGFDLR